MSRNSSEREETYRNGDIIVREGDESREMYVIQNGAVVISKHVDGGEVEIARLSRGDFFGEMSLLESLPRYGTIRAVGDTKLLVIDPGALLLKIRRNPTFAFEMLQRMSSRIRRINQKLMELVSSGSVSDEVSKTVAVLRDAIAYPQGEDQPA
jgi:CRP-like cAMP-binding protein